MIYKLHLQNRCKRIVIFTHNKSLIGKKIELNFQLSIKFTTLLVMAIVFFVLSLMLPTNMVPVHHTLNSDKFVLIPFSNVQISLLVLCCKMTYTLSLGNGPRQLLW